MKKYRVFITRRIPDAGIALLEDRGYAVEIYEKDQSVPQELLAKRVATCDGLISLLSDRIDQSIIDRAGALKIIANYAAGYNNIDVAHARSKGIEVTNTPDILTPATADLTWALILAVSKRIVESDAFLRAGKFAGWGPLLMLGAEITGKTLGIIGAGRIGQAVGRRAKGFDMQLLYYSRKRGKRFEGETGARFLQLEALLKESDFITFHCPLTEDTYHLLNRERMKLLKSTAFVINTSRGAVIEEEALIEALAAGRIAGAGLDVFEKEPQVPERLIQLKNVVLLPHIGSATLETRSEMARIAAKNVISVLENNKALNPVP